MTYSTLSAQPLPFVREYRLPKPTIGARSRNLARYAGLAALSLLVLLFLLSFMAFLIDSHSGAHSVAATAVSTRGTTTNENFSALEIFACAAIIFNGFFGYIISKLIDVHRTRTTASVTMTDGYFLD